MYSAVLYSFLSCLSIYFWLYLVFHCCKRAFSSCGAELLIAVASHCRAPALGVRASVVAVYQLTSCSTWAQLLQGTWNLPEPETEPMFPALAGRFLSTITPGKSICCILDQSSRSIIRKIIKYLRWETFYRISTPYNYQNHDEK